MARSALVFAVTSALLGGCAHSEPIDPGGYGPDGPFSNTFPRRLTYNSFADRTPAWTADGRQVLYSYEGITQGARDRCLGGLLAAGGSRQTDVCITEAGHEDSIDVIEYPAERGGKLAFLRSSSGRFQVAPSRRFLMVAPFPDARLGTSVRDFPYFGVAGSVDALTALTWLSPTKLVFAAVAVLYTRQCQGCVLDTIPQGRDLVLVDLAGTGPPLELPGTLGANSAAAASDGSGVYFTVENDSRIYRYDLQGGQVTTIYDFGPGRVARDLSGAGDLLVAVVGGRITRVIDPINGDYSLDAGGPLVQLDLVSLVETLVDVQGQLFRRPALSTSHQLVAEGYPARFTPIFDNNGNLITVDTTVSRVGDLWLVTGP